ncbi:MFS transporter [Microcella sp.]|uniref:MFS transporter n=1 Tax=Microcella sp. TaxID=1913979 RepID=UPI003315F807
MHVRSRSHPEPKVYRLRATFACALLVHVGINGVRPMSSYRALELGVGTESLGLLNLSFGAVALLLAMPLGSAADSRGAKPVIVWSVATLACGAGLATVAPNFSVLLVSQALCGVGLVGSAVGFHSLVANVGPLSGGDTRFGTFSVVVATGQLIGPILAGAVAEFGMAGNEPYGARGALLGVVVLAVMGAAVALVLPDSRVSVPATVRKNGTRAVGKILRSGSARRALLVSTLVFLAVDLLSTFLPAYGVHVGWSIGTVTVLLGLRAAASILSRLLLGRLLTLMRRSGLLVGGSLLGAAALVIPPLVPLPHGTVVAAVALFIFGVGIGVGQPITMAWLVRTSPNEHRSLGIGARLSVIQAGQILVPPAMGVLVAFAGPAWIFWGLSALLASVAATTRRGGVDPTAEVAPVEPD